jgi:metal-responsive CopG/Arc/MetJ family transcriptional regulator
LLEEVDMAVREQGVSRSHFLRQAVERNLRHYQNVERAVFARIYQQGIVGELRPKVLREKDQ